MSIKRWVLNPAYIFVTVIVVVLGIAGILLLRQYINSNSHNNSRAGQEGNAPDENTLDCPIEVNKCITAIIEDIPGDENNGTFLEYGEASESALLHAVFDGSYTVSQDKNKIFTITISNDERGLRASYVFIGDVRNLPSNGVVTRGQVIGTVRPGSILLREKYLLVFGIVDIKENKSKRFSRISEDFPRILLEK